MTEEIKFNEQVKAATTEKHKKLEEAELSKVMMSPVLTVAAYNEYLQRMYSFISLFEEKYYDKLAAVVQDVNDRKKAATMVNDIKATGTLKESSKPAKWFSGTDSTGFLLGAMYVIEGSTLGGRFLYGNANKVLGLNEINGASYFAAYGSETGTKWKTFLAALNNYAAAHPGEQQDIIAGANFTFDAFYDILK
ncbi:MAG TPA: biliverdin-producing heme oxygenase [Chitinophagales bacterium]|nr:biliverdin-producing heme oxygenase [Chitinophagales bacterium]